MKQIATAMNPEKMAGVLEMLREFHTQGLAIEIVDSTPFEEIVNALDQCGAKAITAEARNDLVIEIYDLDGPYQCFPHGPRYSPEFVWNWIKDEAKKSPNRKSKCLGRLPNNILEA
jgi:hypothetical protein